MGENWTVPMADGMVMHLPVTSLTAAVCAALYIALTICVSRNRLRVRALLGDAGDADLNRAVRAHGNFAEYAPLFLVMLALCEAQGTPEGWLGLLAVIFVSSRALHSTSMLYMERKLKTVRLRMLSMLLMLVSFLLLTVQLLLLGTRNFF